MAVWMFGDWYGIRKISFFMLTVHLLILSLVVNLFSRKVPWSYHIFYVNRVYVDLEEETDIKGFDCKEYIKNERKGNYCR